MRASEFIYYINQNYEPTPLQKIEQYSHLGFNSMVLRAGKDYRKRLKKGEDNEKNNSER